MPVLDAAFETHHSVHVFRDWRGKSLQRTNLIAPTTLERLTDNSAFLHVHPLESMETYSMERLTTPPYKRGCSPGRGDIQGYNPPGL